ncbi:hypothetical protein, partial [Paeniglutamicibacter sulfureus]|uniref:hypothetical protein n=1 Tax=Paeniglutamicibacter sulfureus TaxID=43666 RepID=UPI0035EF98ED
HGRLVVKPGDAKIVKQRDGQHPYIYSARYVAGLMAQSRFALGPRLPAATYKSLIGLLSVADPGI